VPTTIQARIRELLANEDRPALQAAFEELQPFDLAELLREREDREAEQVRLLGAAGPELAAQALEHLSHQDQYRLLDHLAEPAALGHVVALAFFILLLIGTGGNSGAQASTLVIRAMALGEVTLRDFARVIWRETRTGLALGAAMAVMALGLAGGGRHRAPHPLPGRATRPRALTHHSPDRSE
jgi:Mg/Co/Ni transporter MgtE